MTLVWRLRRMAERDPCGACRVDPESCQLMMSSSVRLSAEPWLSDGTSLRFDLEKYGRNLKLGLNCSRIEMKVRKFLRVDKSWQTSIKNLFFSHQILKIIQTKMFRRFAHKILCNRGPFKTFVRSTSSEVFRKRRMSKRARAAIKKSSSKATLKDFIMRQLLANFPDDLTKLKSFEIKIVTKTVEVKSEGF
jgi:hypothetical protein